MNENSNQNAPAESLVENTPANLKNKVWKGVAILLSVWCWLSVLSMSYCTLEGFKFNGNPIHNEAWEAVQWCLALGLPGLLSLPILSFIKRRAFSYKYSLYLNIPVLVALSLVCLYILLISREA